MNEKRIPFIFSVSILFLFAEIVGSFLALAQAAVLSLALVINPIGLAIGTFFANISDSIFGTQILVSTALFLFIVFGSSIMLSLITLILFIMLASLLAKDFIKLHDYFIATIICLVEMIPILGGGTFWLAFGIYLARSMALRKFSSAVSGV